MKELNEMHLPTGTNVNAILHNWWCDVMYPPNFWMYSTFKNGHGTQLCPWATNILLSSKFQSCWRIAHDHGQFYSQDISTCAISVCSQKYMVTLWLYLNSLASRIFEGSLPSYIRASMNETSAHWKSSVVILETVMSQKILISYVSEVFSRLLKICLCTIFNL